ncbi:cell-cycle control medial ring component-domain-containing protein [Schizothecium vesticola]|uniref:Cell-cycle control medial ring component-domain-containing protein n=1 Tax=Schizothecium vesticola TaxID=314040 RepID=A0AA40JZL1_9PEZI|nr:cell-cycle control medial ring component-domain-containing protein [Schizothecium vesticola]
MAATEIAFAKSFLALLDTKPTKITPDHVEDPRGYPSSSPVQTPPRRPRNPNNPSPTTATTTAPGSDPSLQIHIRSLRNPPLDLKLPSLPLATTSALDIKLAVAAETSIPVERIKLLLSKKPVPDTRSLREMVASVGEVPAGGLELGVMVMGGWSGAVGKKAGLSGRGVLETEAFWGDLKGFLEQRIRDEGVAGEVVERFRGAWGRG